MEPSHWSQLPHTAVVNMFSCLSHRDRARVSSTCKSWRDCYFHPSFWRRINLELTVQTGCEPARLILDKCGRFVRELHLTCTVVRPVLCGQFASRNASASVPPPTGSEESSLRNQPDDLLNYWKLYKDLPRVLQGLHNGDGLEKFIFCFFSLCKSCDCGTRLPEEEFETKMTDSLKKVLQASSKLKTLALAHNMGSSQSSFLKELTNKFGKQLQVLHIPSFQVTEEATDEAVTVTTSLSKFSSLSILTLNLSTVTDQLLKSLPDSKCASTLRRLNLVVGFGEDVTSYLDDSSWGKLGRRLPELQVTVSAIISDCGATDELLHYLTPSIPLTSLRIFVSHPRSLKEDLMDNIGKNYSKSLSCLEIHTDKPTLLFDDNSEADPLVMLCWQCKKLNHLVITGYKLLICNILAIATLRGPSLSTLEVERGHLCGDHDETWANEEYDEETQTSHDSLYSDGTFSDSPTSEMERRFTLIHDISSSLKRPWEPVERRHMTIPKFLTQDLLMDADG